MDTQSALATVAEVGIGISGFSTIAAEFATSYAAKRLRRRPTTDPLLQR